MKYVAYDYAILLSSIVLTWLVGVKWHVKMSVIQALITSVLAVFAVTIMPVTYFCSAKAVWIAMIGYVGNKLAGNVGCISIYTLLSFVLVPLVYYIGESEPIFTWRFDYIWESMPF